MLVVPFMGHHSRSSAPSHPVSELSYLGISTKRLEDRIVAPGGWVR